MHLLIAKILNLIKIKKFKEAQIKCDDIKKHFDEDVEFLHIYGFIFFNLKNLNKIWLYLLIQFASVYGLFYSIWHVGVENKILKGPAGCSAMLTSSENASDLKAQILSKQVISCDEVIWSFFGISAASINTLVLLVIFIFNAIYLYRNNGFKKEKNI